MMMLSWSHFSPNMTLMYLNDNGVNYDISRYAKACAHMVQTYDKSGRAPRRVAAVLVVMNLLTKEEMMEKLPSTFRYILRAMTKWMKCNQDGSEFNLESHWYNYQREDLDEWLTPLGYIAGNFTVTLQVKTIPFQNLAAKIR